LAFFDNYVPSPTVCCPVCGSTLTDWTGLDGPCVSLIVRQDIAGAELPEWWDDPAEGGGTVLDPALANLPHPNSFLIESRSCTCEFPIELRCFSENGTWNRCEMVTGSAEDRVLKGPEQKEAYNRRMKWLDGAF